MAWKRLIVSLLFFSLGLAVLAIGGNITGGVTGVADWEDSYYIFFAGLLFFLSGFFLLLSVVFDKSLRFSGDEPVNDEKKVVSKEDFSKQRTRKYSNENRKSSDY